MNIILGSGTLVKALLPGYTRVNKCATMTIWQKEAPLLVRKIDPGIPTKLKSD